MKIILRDMEPGDWILGIRAARWMTGSSQKDAVISYGEHPNVKDFYVKRNKVSITVRPCYPPSLSTEQLDNT